MFEFEDSKLGRVKVVNITEARAAIASIMNDKESNYIITKNNKPVRVIINYDTFRKNQAHFISSPVSQSARKKESEPTPSSLIKGLIESREKEIKTQLGKSTEPVQQVVNGAEEPFHFPEGEGDYLATEESQDYFKADEQEPSPTESVSPVAEQTPPLAEESVEEASPDPAKDDYFNRYRKLYEPAARNERMDSRPAGAQPDLKPAPRFSEPISPAFEPPAERQEEERLAPAAHPVAKTLAREEPLSLQDLLKELEDEQLSE